MMFEVDTGPEAAASQWEQWTAATSSGERLTAAVLIDADEGDVFEPDHWPGLDVTIEVTAVHERWGHRRVYATIDENGIETRVRFVVVRGKYVFVFAAESDEDFLITADWSDDGIDALLRPSDRVG